VVQLWWRPIVLVTCSPCAVVTSHVIQSGMKMAAKVIAVAATNATSAVLYTRTLVILALLLDTAKVCSLLVCKVLTLEGDEGFKKAQSGW